jgi:hypothetical protein
MSAAAVIALLELLTQAIPLAQQLAAEVQSAASATDQASLNTAIAALQAAAQKDVAQAVADLNAVS